jgi:hypothetical protein
MAEEAKERNDRVKGSKVRDMNVGSSTRRLRKYNNEIGMSERLAQAKAGDSKTAHLDCMAL